MSDGTLLFEEESAIRLISQFVFHDAQGMHQFLMVSRLIAVYSVCLEILPFRKKLAAPAQEPRKRKLLSQKESQQAQIGSVYFYAPMGMLPLGRDLILLAEEASYF